MKKDTAKAELGIGVYRLHWKDGGSSIAAVGRDAEGVPWMAPTNWVGGVGSTDWARVDRAERLSSPNGEGQPGVGADVDSVDVVRELLALGAALFPLVATAGPQIRILRDGSLWKVALYVTPTSVYEEHGDTFGHAAALIVRSLAGEIGKVRAQGKAIDAALEALQRVQ